MVIIGESSSSLGLPEELCWLPLSPPASLEVCSSRVATTARRP